jgi:hypothetical protein
VLLGSDSQRHHMFALPSRKAQGRNCRRSVVEKPAAEFLVAPRARHDLRSIARTDLGLVSVDQHIERRGVDIALLGQHRFQGANAQLQRTERTALMTMTMTMIVSVVGSAHSLML